MKIYIVSFISEYGGKAFMGIKDQTMAFTDKKLADLCEGDFIKRYGEDTATNLIRKEAMVFEKPREMILTGWNGTPLE